MERSIGVQGLGDADPVYSTGPGGGRNVDPRQQRARGSTLSELHDSTVPSTEFLENTPPNQIPSFPFPGSAFKECGWYFRV